jgi:hypothetical protein
MRTQLISIVICFVGDLYEDIRRSYPDEIYGAQNKKFKTVF